MINLLITSEKPSAELLNRINTKRISNTREQYKNRSQEPMWPQTMDYLDKFFEPYNLYLAELLGDPKFLWLNHKRKRPKPAVVAPVVQSHRGRNITIHGSPPGKHLCKVAQRLQLCCYMLL